LKLQELSRIEDFQGLIAEDFYMSGKNNFPKHDALIEVPMIDELGKGLYTLAQEHSLLIAGVAKFSLNVNQGYICCELIVAKFNPTEGTALAYVPDLDFDFLKSKFDRSRSIDLLHEGSEYRLYLTKAFVKMNAVVWILTKKIDIK
jgi:hypothetical protein